MTKEELIEKMLNKNMRMKRVEEFDFFLEKVTALGIYSCFSSGCYRNSLNVTVALSTEFCDNPQFEFNTGKRATATELKYNKDFVEFSDFASWFKEEKQPPKKKRGRRPNKREKLEARLSQVEETTKKAFTCICDKEGYELGVFRSGKYTVPLGDMNPEQAVQFAKWVLDLEGGK